MIDSVERYAFSGNGRVPNSRLPALIYRNVIRGTTPEFEETLRTNGWPPDWHSALGMYPRHHFHSDTHELIAVTRGEMTAILGGHDGKSVRLRQGDVVVIPAGVGHLGTAITDDLRLTGSFPEGFGVHDFRLCRPDEYSELAAVAERVPVPAYDPIYGPSGPLPTIWRDRI